MYKFVELVGGGSVIKTGPTPSRFLEGAKATIEKDTTRHIRHASLHYQSSIYIAQNTFIFNLTFVCCFATSSQPWGSYY